MRIENGRSGVVLVIALSILLVIAVMEQEFEARGGPPDPSEATIQQLNGDADAVAGCGDQVVQQVQTAIQNANAALGGCPGGL